MLENTPQTTLWQTNSKKFCLIISYNLYAPFGYYDENNSINYRRKLSTLDFKHNSQHVAAASAASTAQQNGNIAVSVIQGQQIVSPAQQQVFGGSTGTAGQVATLLSQQPQQMKVATGGNHISPTLSGKFHDSLIFLGLISF